MESEQAWTNGFSAALVMPDKEFANLTRSTIPLLCYWRNRLQSPCRRLQERSTCPPVDLVTAHAT